MSKILTAAVLSAVLSAVIASAAPAGGPLRIKASPAVQPCAAAAAAEYQRATGRAVAVETAAIGMPDSVAGADVVVAADSELNRVIESGMTHPDQELDVASIPWVLAGAPGAAAPSLQAAAGPGRTTALVDVLGGNVARETWRRLAQQGLMPVRSERGGRSGREPRESPRLQPGEAAVVPLSLAGTAAVTPLDVPALRARALGVRASGRPEAVRAFLDFLAGERGGAAFRGCGRAEAR